MMNGGTEQVHVLDHASGKILSSFGRPGHQVGNFTTPHSRGRLQGQRLRGRNRLGAGCRNSGSSGSRLGRALRETQHPRHGRWVSQDSTNLQAAPGTTTRASLTIAREIGTMGGAKSGRYNRAGYGYRLRKSGAGHSCGPGAGWRTIELEMQRRTFLLGAGGAFASAYVPVSRGPTFPSPTAGTSRRPWTPARPISAGWSRTAARIRASSVSIGRVTRRWCTTRTCSTTATSARSCWCRARNSCSRAISGAPTTTPFSTSASA